jgi:hypothetical protein
VGNAQRPADLKVDIDKLIEMRNSGISQDVCAKTFHVNYRVIRRLLDSLCMPRSVITVQYGTCPVCGKTFKKERSSRKICSGKCVAVYLANPRVDDVEVSKMYSSGMTQQEVADAIGVSLKSIQKSLKRSGTAVRKAAKRDQYGEKNTSWRGKNITYKGAHHRVRLKRGKPTQCSACGAKDTEKLEWANVSGQYHDPEDYIPLCVKCHRGLDAERRKNAQR